jgi:uncharacterized protein (DUF302 family)
MNKEIGFEIELDTTYEETLERVKKQLKVEGFGVLTSIDVQATLHEKLDEDFRPYTILGACNPPLAHRALAHDPVVGLVLPCNVTVEATETNGSVVRIANPEVLLTSALSSEDPVLAAVAEEARTRLERVADALIA